jgi:hypothetical protein
MRPAGNACTCPFATGAVSQPKKFFGIFSAVAICCARRIKTAQPQRSSTLVSAKVRAALRYRIFAARVAQLTPPKAARKSLALRKKAVRIHGRSGVLGRAAVALMSPRKIARATFSACFSENGTLSLKSL